MSCLTIALFLPILCVADDPPAVTTLARDDVAFEVAKSGWHELKRGPIRAVFVDNSAVDNDVLPGHRAGYSGLALLSHEQQPRSPFVPAYAGLNFEHIHDGTTQQRDILFEPRRAEMELRIVDEHTVELYQPPTPHWGLESCTRYHLQEDGAIEMTFECIPRRDSFRNDYIGLFWASYIAAPESKWIHFRGVTDDADEVTWIEGQTPSHGDQPTHLARDDQRQFAHDADFPLSLVFHRSRHRYQDPWYFGICRDMAVAFVFRSQDQIRLTQSPSGGGRENPAWDFQTFMQPVEVDRRYQMVMRLVYVPYESHEQVEEAVAVHRQELAAQR